MEKTQVCVRFAPSPTGYLHIGNARTALFNYLHARSTGGRFIIRIEDTDRERSDRRYEEALLEDLRWLGLDWDEGGGKGGPHEPYRQSERLDIYRDALRRLLDEGKAYPCYCTSDELDARRRQAMAEGRDPVYDGRCREMGSAERSRLEADGRGVSYRYRVGDRPVVIDDVVRGKVEFDASLMGDTVIVKSDGMPTFHFAVTVDDALMGVTCVLRGEGHLPNAPIQILLAEDLGFVSPQFAHMSQTLAPDGGKLSKRRGAMSLREFREKGYLPGAVANYMALLGWSPSTGSEVFSLEDAVSEFDIRNLARSSSYFDPAKFSYICRKHMQAAAPERIAVLAEPFLTRAGVKGAGVGMSAAIAVAKERCEKLEDLADDVRQYFSEVSFDDEAAAVLSEPASIGVLRFFAGQLAECPRLCEKDLREAFKKTQSATGAKGRALYMPVRAALTGSVNGPEILEILPILGVERAMERLERAAAFAGGVGVNGSS